MGRTGRFLLAISGLLSWALLLVAAQVSQKPLPGTDLPNTWTALNNFTGGLQANGVAVPSLPINLATGVTGTLPGANLPATTSNCSGVQFAQGLNAGMTPVCATPPTFVASGGSHAVGYVPDPGSSAGTTRFLREDATWVAPPAGGAVYSTASASGTSNLGSTTMATAGSSGNKYIFTATAYVTAAGTSCTGNTTVALSVSFTDNVTNNAFTLNLVGVNDPGLIGGTGGMGLSPTLGLNNSAVGQTISWYPLTINAKASTTVSYSATYTAGTNCSPGPAFYLMPQLTQIQ